MTGPWPKARVLKWRIALYRLKEHSLYWSTDEAKNDGSAVASFLVKGG
jgi:hypothetical protein